MATTTTRTVGHTDTPTDAYLGPTQVGRRLGISREYAGRLMRTGVIPGVVDLAAGSGERAVLRVTAADLQAWVDSRAL